MPASRLDMLKQIAAGLAAQFGKNCEIVIHDLTSGSLEHSIVHIENGGLTDAKSETVHPESYSMRSGTRMDL